MHCSTALVSILFGLRTAAAPSADPEFKTASSPSQQKTFSFPLPNGFPNISPGSAALQQIQKEAHGTLPNGPLPSRISDTSAVVWQLIAFNELFEVAYFSNLLRNISNGASGYSIGTPAARNVITNALTAVRAQEELHALGANGILKAAGRDQVKPCKYVFPVKDFDSAITFAATFTDVVLGTLQEALTNFGLDGDNAFLGLVGSVIGQEGEQNGFYRNIGRPSRIPSSQPFLTGSSSSFALSALYQLVIVPGSCPSKIPQIPIFKALNVNTQNINPQTKDVQFSFVSYGSRINTDGLRIVYINGQNKPVVQKLSNIQNRDKMVKFSAPFPYKQFQLDGLTIAAVTNSSGPFSSASDVAKKTLYGPGLIEVN